MLKRFKNGMPPLHPGEMLNEEFLKPKHLSANALARAIGVPPNRITNIVAGKRSITADTAILLARHFKMSPEFWLNLQLTYDLRTAEIAAEARAKKTG